MEVVGRFMVYMIRRRASFRDHDEFRRIARRLEGEYDKKVACS
jgi:hypothetical protein